MLISCLLRSSLCLNSPRLSNNNKIVITTYNSIGGSRVAAATVLGATVGALVLLFVQEFSQRTASLSC